jgi:hypothetical protein
MESHDAEYRENGDVVPAKFPLKGHQWTGEAFMSRNFKGVKFVKEPRRTSDGRTLDTWIVHPDSRDELERQMNDVLRNAFGMTLDELRDQVEGKEI